MTQLYYCSNPNHSQCGVRFMVFTATFNNISVILWQSVLLVEQTRVPEENHQLVESQSVWVPNTIF